MALIFQYGSNMSTARLNHSDRLAGDATPKCLAKTIEMYELVFSVWSKTNKCAAADIDKTKSGRDVYGVVYEIPDHLLARETAKLHGRRSMDAIEGEGTNYVRQRIELESADGSRLSAITYVVKEPKTDIQTQLHYVQHIFDGIEEHGFPVEYRKYVAKKVIANNSALAGPMQPYLVDA
jgi:gamma-glutamylcyclotransferase